MNDSLVSKSVKMLVGLVVDAHARNRLPRAIWRSVRGPEPIFLDYPIQPRPRFGYGLPAHPELYDLINQNRSSYLQTLSCFDKYADKLSSIDEIGNEDGQEPYWQNDYIGGLDAIALYSFSALRNPPNYVEIGSGNSTKFVRRSIDDNRLRTKLTSIDPMPRAAIDSICDEIIREPLEDMNLELFETLGHEDIVVFDGSHHIFQNSDATVFFLEILPRLSPGVLVYVDDIFLPYDYPAAWRDRFYSEQYILAALLLGDRMRRYDIVLPHVFIDNDPELFKASSALWAKIGRHAKQGNRLGPHGRSGNGMWLSIL